MGFSKIKKPQPSPNHNKKSNEPFMNPVSFILIILLISCSDTRTSTSVTPSFVEIKNMRNVQGDTYYDVFLIENPPSDSVSICNAVQSFQKKNGRNTDYRNHNRLYIRQHELTQSQKKWGDKEVDYLKQSSINDIHISDMILNYAWYTGRNKDTTLIKYYDH